MTDDRYIASQKITAIILAGGASSRMGSDKALLEWRDHPFIVHIIESLRTQADDIVINTNSPRDFAQFNLPTISDAGTDRRGPLAGILAAMNYSTTPWTLVVPCDNPLLSTRLVARLAVALEQEQSDLAFAYSNDDNHYLYALMRTELRDSLMTFLSGNDYAVRRWYSTLHVSRVDFSDQPECFRNINSADDLAQLPR